MSAARLAALVVTIGWLAVGAVAGVSTLAASDEAPWQSRDLRLAVAPSLEPLPESAARRWQGSSVAELAILGTGWQHAWDRRSDRLHLLQGRGLPLIPGRGNDLERDAEEPAGLRWVAERVLRLLERHPALLDVSTADLRLDPLRSRRLGEEDGSWSVVLGQHHRGVPVTRAHVFARVRHGNVVQLGSVRVADVRTTTEPRLTVESAWRRVAAQLDAAEVEPPPAPEASLVLVPILPSGGRPGEAYRGVPGRGYHHLLTWRFRFPLGSPVTWHRADVDAHDGRLVELVSLARTATATVTGQVPSIDGMSPPSVRPLPFASVDNDGPVVTDIDGRYRYQGGEATLRLDGRYTSIEDACGSIRLTDAIDGNLDLGGAPATDCVVAGLGGPGNTDAARSAFFYLTAINRKASTFFPDLAWLDGTLLARTNIGAVTRCNALWDGQALQFFQGDDGCANLGEVPTVVLHEWLHALDTNTGGPAVEEGTAEALADVLAALEAGDACIGRGFDLDGTPCLGCRPDCDGLRDIAAFLADGPSSIARPDNIEADDGLDCDRFAGCPYVTPSGSPYTGPMGYQAHCESQVVSGALWGLRTRLRERYGAAAGDEAIEALFWPSIVPIESAYRVADGGTCNPSAVVDGCGAESAYTVLLAVDDDDGDLANGTPNACRIWQALNDHGIACGTPLRCTADRDQPPVLKIASPSAGAVFDAGEGVELRAGARDAEDGDLSSSIVWTSSRDGVLGTGAELRLEDLSIGLHVLRADVADSTGSSGRDLRTIRVVGSLVFDVTKGEDTADGVCDADCSLREAVIAANANPAPDTIVLPAGTFTMTRLGVDEGRADRGDLNLLDAVTIRGAGAMATTLVGDGFDRILTAARGQAVLEDLTLTGGSTRSGITRGIEGVGEGGFGGAAFVSPGARLVLRRVEVRANVAIGDLPFLLYGGGGVAVAAGGVLRVEASTFLSNRTVGALFGTHGGGALLVRSGGEATLVNTTIAFNETRPAFADNRQASGIQVEPSGRLKLHQVTVAHNPAGTTGFGLAFDAGAEVQLSNTLVRGGCGVAGGGRSFGGNVESPSTSCPFDEPSDRPSMSLSGLALGNLALHGGSTRTLPLEAGSAALDVAVAVSCAPVDQRGVLRPQDGDGSGTGGCDPGAYERLPPAESPKR